MCQRDAENSRGSDLICSIPPGLHLHAFELRERFNNLSVCQLEIASPCLFPPLWTKMLWDLHNSQPRFCSEWKFTICSGAQMLRSAFGTENSFSCSKYFPCSHRLLQLAESWLKSGCPRMLRQSLNNPHWTQGAEFPGLQGSPGLDSFPWTEASGGTAPHGDLWVAPREVTGFRRSSRESWGWAQSTHSAWDYSRC